MYIPGDENFTSVSRGNGASRFVVNDSRLIANYRRYVHTIARAILPFAKTYKEDQSGNNHVCENFVETIL